MLVPTFLVYHILQVLMRTRGHLCLEVSMVNWSKVTQLNLLVISKEQVVPINQDLTYRILHLSWIPNQDLKGIALWCLIYSTRTHKTDRICHSLLLKLLPNHRLKFQSISILIKHLWIMHMESKYRKLQRYLTFNLLEVAVSIL